MNAQPLVAKTYLSQSKLDWTDEAIDELLERSKRNNATRKITGAMIYANGYFMQLIEGPQIAVDELYSAIEADPRHEVLSLLHNQEIKDRHFSDWAMEYRDSDDLGERALMTVHAAKQDNERFPVIHFLECFNDRK
jgi:hypothetical protein|tara:strand:- start:1199 stop:1606 length:408 start_codon:yes stop_codon:yes gene_type:complete